ncbi:PE-PGRS family protein [Strigomonas culicis]|uniref:PE-PGRS family protein n=1 Tax=Strigomonas culicis TaxID=28005 RepID=S9THR1_9TRYP|nr:PE-PGRS family protein [Strigomonas culicis]|eukprot:EPY17572.1 PE-PGRS family protein [Strigomonas culicis]
MDGGDQPLVVQPEGRPLLRRRRLAPRRRAVVAGHGGDGEIGERRAAGVGLRCLLFDVTRPQRQHIVRGRRRLCRLRVMDVVQRGGGGRRGHPRGPAAPHTLRRCAGAAGRAAGALPRGRRPRREDGQRRRRAAPARPRRGRQRGAAAVRVRLWRHAEEGEERGVRRRPREGVRQQQPLHEGLQERVQGVLLRQEGARRLRLIRAAAEHVAQRGELIAREVVRGGQRLAVVVTRADAHNEAHHVRRVEGQAEGVALVQHDAEGPEVVAEGVAAAQRELGAHVKRRADEGPRVEERLPLPRRRVGRRPLQPQPVLVRRRVLAAEHTRDAKVTNLDLIREPADVQVGRLDVPVQDRVGLVQ